MRALLALVAAIGKGAYVRVRLPLELGERRVPVWLVNLRDDCLEVDRTAVQEERRYESVRVLRPDDVLPPPR